MKTAAIFLGFFFISLQAFSQERELTGKVSQMGGSEIPGARVEAYEAPAVRTLSGTEGKYRLRVPPEVEHLKVSYAGMKTKIVEVGRFNTVNIVLIPENYKRFRFGFGISTGGSNFTASTDPDIHSTDTSMTVEPKNLALQLSLFCNFNKKVSLQAILEGDANFFKYTDSLGNQKQGGMFRSVAAFPVNYNLVIGKSGNYSAFFGAGPLVNYLDNFDKFSGGFRVHAGASINNYGFNSRFYLDYDYSGGKLAVENAAEPVKFSYNCVRLGAVFFF